jgi:hypothetical protein
LDLNATQILMLEDKLKKDLEAISRVKGLLGLNGTAPHARLNEVEADETEAPVTSLRSTIERIVNGDPYAKWTTAKVLAKLQADKYPLKAQKPIYSVGQSLQKLAESERIRLTRRGVGSSPNIYRALENAGPTNHSEEDVSKE